MTPTEKTILQVARKTLEDAYRAAEMAPESIMSSFWQLQGLTMLTIYRDHGLSEETVSQLSVIERDLAKLVGRLGAEAMAMQLAQRSTNH